MFPQHLIKNASEKREAKQSLTILVPGCGGFPSGEEFLKQINTFNKNQPIHLWLFDPFLDDEVTEGIKQLETVIAKKNYAVTVHSEQADLKSFYEKHPNFKADIIYLEHPQTDLPSKLAMDSLHYRDQFCI